MDFLLEDKNDEYSEKDGFKDNIQNLTDSLLGLSHITEIEESAEFEWDDDLKINNVNATKDDYDKYFKLNNWR